MSRGGESLLPWGGEYNYPRQIGPNNTRLMDRTVEVLAKEIEDKTNIEVGKFGCFEIKTSNLTIALEYSEDIKNFLNLIKDSPVNIIKFEEGTDPRPLYFIPYDPNILQTKEEQELCRRILFERILSYVITYIFTLFYTLQHEEVFFNEYHDIQYFFIDIKHK